MTVLAEARTNAEGPQIVLLVLLLQAACERAKAEPEIEKVRLLLRRGQREAAAQRIEALAAVLGNDGRVQAIRAYLFELKPRGLLEFLFTRGERLQDGQRQQLLQWLLSEEIARGVKALKAKNYDEAKNVFDRAAQIDDRCAVVCFLFGRTVYEGIDAASEQGASTDLATHQADLTKAIRMVRSAVRDREVGKQCKLLLRVLSSRSEQIAEVRLEIARMERQARPVNQLIQRFNILMESLEHTGIGCTSDLTRAADEFRQIHRAATLLIRKGGVSPQGKDALTRLAGAAERHERELNAVREQMEARECMEQFRNLMDKYQKSPISTPDEHRQAVIAFLELWDKTRKVRAGSTDKEGVMGKLEEAIEKILKQLAA
jgi:tetratricopeptide (TPR) repeat protein